MYRIIPSVNLMPPCLHTQKISGSNKPKSDYVSVGESWKEWDGGRIGHIYCQAGGKWKCGTLWSVIIMSSEKVKAEQESKYRPLYTDPV